MIQYLHRSFVRKGKRMKHEERNAFEAALWLFTKIVLLIFQVSFTLTSFLRPCHKTSSEPRTSNTFHRFSIAIIRWFSLSFSVSRHTSSNFSIVKVKWKNECESFPSQPAALCRRILIRSNSDVARTDEENSDWFSSNRVKSKDQRTCPNEFLRWSIIETEKNWHLHVVLLSRSSSLTLDRWLFHFLSCQTCHFIEDRDEVLIQTSSQREKKAKSSGESSWTNNPLNRRTMKRISFHLIWCADVKKSISQICLPSGRNHRWKSDVFSPRMILFDGVHCAPLGSNRIEWEGRGRRENAAENEQNDELTGMSFFLILPDVQFIVKRSSSCRFFRSESRRKAFSFVVAARIWRFSDLFSFCVGWVSSSRERNRSIDESSGVLGMSYLKRAEKEITGLIRRIKRLKKSTRRKPLNTKSVRNSKNKFKDRSVGEKSAYTIIREDFNRNIVVSTMKINSQNHRVPRWVHEIFLHWATMTEFGWSKISNEIFIHRWISSLLSAPILQKRSEHLHVFEPMLRWITSNISSQIEHLHLVTLRVDLPDRFYFQLTSSPNSFSLRMYLIQRSI